MIASLTLIAPLLAASLAVLTAVAALPALLLATPSPRPRPPASLAVAASPLQLVRTGRGLWFVNGQPIAEPSLARLLHQQRRSGADIRFLPSAQLPVAHVGASLAWLRRQAGRPVALDLPAGAAPQR